MTEQEIYDRLKANLEDTKAAWDAGDIARCHTLAIQESKLLAALRAAWAVREKGDQ